jgi:hypothetical protein
MQDTQTGYREHNERFIIDPKYDMGVGLIAIDHTQKLIRHFEVCAYPTRHLTIDLYENGLFQCNVQIVGGCMPSPPHTKFRMNLTHGHEIDDICIKLVEGVYRPFCERIDITETYLSNDGKAVPKWLGYLPNHSSPTYTHPLIYQGRASDNNIVGQTIEHLIDQTFFSTLVTIQELYSMRRVSVLNTIYTQLQKHASDIQKISDQVQELIEI